ncbi:hypothetical protein IAI10_20140 [Clostridium sp. 19966]|uniref:MBL fold metallo-hydrolase n=1 Tax=Clostridium sp. 19966 TaxID=2768166 RepID=UPI0028DE8EED|nr:MBL fold metallo-hydrolase [Clostridium sp. 19966]MDT8718967.1 hypothetical protein [Clostridium sp. 19966]
MESQTKIKFYSGTRKIGGTVVSIEYENERIIIDFGRGFTPAAAILDKKNAMLDNYVEKYLTLGMLPKIDGFYSEKNIPEKTEILPLEETNMKTKVFISHLHLDHMEYMGLVDEKVDVYMTEDSLKLYKALDKVKEGVLGTREYKAIAYDEKLEFNNVKVTALRVDHDVRGACSYIVETPDLKILYSGDLRLKGLHPEWTLNMAERAREEGINVLIFESTTIGSVIKKEALERYSKETNGEKNLAERIIEAIEQHEGIAIFNTYHRNVDRIAEFHKAAIKTNRKLVLELSTAYLAYELLGIKDFYIIEEKDLVALEYHEAVIDFYNNFNKLSISEINKKPGEYILENSFDNIISLLYITTENGIYIHSNGAPLGDYDPAYNSMMDFLDKLDIEYRYIGVSGHANPYELITVAEKIEADIFMPIHGFNPECFHIGKGVRFLPEEGKTYTFTENNIRVLP